jgi:acyl transferase domain-containing protein/thioesterase domain-containing protein
LTRAHLEHRAVVVGRAREQLLDGVARLGRGGFAATIVTGTAARGARLALLFPGRGRWQAGRASALAAAEPVFADALAAVCAALDPHLDRPLQDVLRAPPGSAEAGLLDGALFGHAASFSLQVALYRLLAAWGVRPTVLLGDSTGEIAAAHVAGALSVPDASALVAAYGRESVPAEFATVARGLQVAEPSIPVVSTRTGKPVAAQTLRDPRHWARQGGATAGFADGLRWLEQAGVTAHLELGFDGIRTASGRQAPGRSRALWVSMGSGRQHPAEAVLSAVAELHANGVPVDWAALYAGRGGRRVDLPTYAFQRRRYWPQDARAVRPAGPASAAAAAPAPVRPGERSVDDLLEVVRSEAAAVLGYSSAAAVDGDRTLLELGISSVAAVELQQRLLAATGVELPATLLIDQLTVTSLAAELSGASPSGSGPPPQPAAERTAARQESRPVPRSDGGPVSRDRASPGALATLVRDAHGEGRLLDAVPVLAAAARLRASLWPAAETPFATATVVSEGAANPQIVCVPSILVGSGVHQFVRFAAGFPRRRRVVALTLPGFGPGQTPGSWDLAVDAVARAAQRSAGDGPFVLAGYSTGGVLAHSAAEVLQRAGAGPAGVVLIDTFDPVGDQTPIFGWALGRILDRDEELAVDDEGLLAMSAYLRLLEDRMPAHPAAPSLLVRAGDAGSQRDWPAWPAADTVTAVPADHFSIIEEHAGAAAAAVEAWLSGALGMAAGDAALEVAR